MAANNGDKDIVLCLMDKDADIKAVTSKWDRAWIIDSPCIDLGQTALHLAALRGHAAIVAILVEQGANVHAIDRN